MIFRDKKHEELYKEFDSRMGSHDCYYRPVAYLLALDVVCREHSNQIFDFTNNWILPECLNSSWQTPTSLKTCRLAFNLWNGYCYDDESKHEPSRNYMPNNLFCTDYAPYYWQAIQLCYPDYTEI